MGAISGSFTVELMPDGSVKFDARKLCGEDEELLSELQDFTEALTGNRGDLTVEKHVHKHGESAHTHHHIKAG